MLIEQTYDAHFGGSGNYTSPFHEADLIAFVSVPYSGGQNPIGPGIGGFASLAVRKDMLPILSTAAYVGKKRGCHYA